MNNVFKLTFTVALAMLVTGVASNALLATDGYAVACWPPSGIALAALLLTGNRALAGIILGAMLTNLFNLDGFAQLLHWQLALQALTVTVLSTLQAWLGFWVITRVIKAPLDFSDLKLSVLSLLFAGPVACILASLGGALMLAQTGLITANAVLDNFITWWIGDSIGVLIFTPLLLAGFNFTQVRHRLQVIVPSVAIYLLISATFYLVAVNKIERDEIVQKAQAEIVEEKMFEVLTRLKANTELLASFLSNSEQVTQSEFHAFARRQLQYNPEINVLIWIPKVTRGEVDVFVSAARSEVTPDYTIFTRYSSTTPTENRYPVLYGVFEGGLKDAYGLDISAEPYFPSLLKAGADLFFTPAFKLHTSEKGELGFLVLKAVTNENGDIRGYAASVVSLPSLARSTLANLAFDGVDIALEDHSVEPSKTILPSNIQDTLTLKSKVDARNRSWVLHIYHHKDPHSWSGYWVTQVIGMLFVWFLITFLIAITGNNIRVRDQVARQTKVLREEKAKADQASKAKSQFLANMSHEIRTPINGIKGLHYLIQQESDVDTIHRYVGQAEGALTVLLKVLNDVLDFSKIEADKLSLQQEAVDISTLCEDVMQMISLEAKDKGLEVSLDVDSRVPKTFFTDPIRLKQILLNLLNNAVKFTEQGQVSLAVTFEQDKLKFSVVDTGVGIKESARKQLFQPFAQADGSTSRRFGGTGLGLSICAKLVELMGGTIAFESTEFKGSQFDVYLPLTCNLPHKEPTKSTPQATAEHVDMSGKQILLAEDNPLNQQVAKSMLEGKGATVVIANDGIEALQALSQHRYDLVLMDIQMPNMDGLQATRAIRHEMLLDDLPIIGLSANAQDDDIAMGKKCGMNDYVVKPIDATTLYSTIMKCLSDYS